MAIECLRLLLLLLDIIIEPAGDHGRTSRWLRIELQARMIIHIFVPLVVDRKMRTA